MYKAKKRKSPIKSAREFCLECMEGNTELVKTCVCNGFMSSRLCDLYEYRFGKTEKGNYPDVPILKAIRNYCLNCVDTSDEVKACSTTQCALFDFRFGKNPNIKKREPTEKQTLARQRFAEMSRTK